MSTTHLCLVRHGETAWNAERRLQGHLDIPLNETGNIQAQATASRLATHAFDAVYCSDLLRARQTAEAASAVLGLTVAFERGLRERHYGAFQGMTYDEAAQTYPEAYQRFHSRELDFSFPGEGESLRLFAKRIAATLDTIVARHAGRQILIVTHGGVLDIAHRLATGMALDAHRNFGIPNAALNWIAHDATGWRMLRWADQDHLSDDARDELSNA